MTQNNRQMMPQINHADTKDEAGDEATPKCGTDFVTPKGKRSYSGNHCEAYILPTRDIHRPKQAPRPAY